MESNNELYTSTIVGAGNERLIINGAVTALSDVLKETEIDLKRIQYNVEKEFTDYKLHKISKPILCNRIVTFLTSWELAGGAKEYMDEIIQKLVGVDVNEVKRIWNRINAEKNESNADILKELFVGIADRVNKVKSKLEAKKKLTNHEVIKLLKDEQQQTDEDYTTTVAEFVTYPESQMLIGNFILGVGKSISDLCIEYIKNNNPTPQELEMIEPYITSDIAQQSAD